MSEALRQVVWKCDRCGGDAQAIFGIFPSCKCGSTSFKAAQPPAPTAQQCQCKDRPADQCPGEWEPGCDLGANPAHVRVAQPATDDRLRMALRADLATESLAVDDLLRAMGEDPEHYRTDDGAVNRPRLLAWLKDRAAQPVQQPTARTFADWVNSLTTEETHQFDAAGRGYKKDAHQMMRLAWGAAQAAPAQRQPLSDEEIDSLTFQFLTAELGPTAYDRAIARAIEAAHGITAAPAAQKGEKL